MRKVEPQGKWITLKSGKKVFIHPKTVKLGEEKGHLPIAENLFHIRTRKIEGTLKPGQVPEKLLNKSKAICLAPSVIQCVRGVEHGWWTKNKNFYIYKLRKNIYDKLKLHNISDAGKDFAVTEEHRVFQPIPKKYFKFVGKIKLTGENLDTFERANKIDKKFLGKKEANEKLNRIIDFSTRATSMNKREIKRLEELMKGLHERINNIKEEVKKYLKLKEKK